MIYKPSEWYMNKTLCINLQNMYVSAAEVEISGTFWENILCILIESYMHIDKV